VLLTCEDGGEVAVGVEVVVGVGDECVWWWGEDGLDILHTSTISVQHRAFI